MNKPNHFVSIKPHILTPLVLIGLTLLTGCNSERHRVLAVTGTTIGISVSQNPQTQLYEASLGYKRAEVALVPTNRPVQDENAQGGVITGANQSAEVLMELRQTGIFSSSGSIYQRLAVGHAAVTQPGAAFLLAKDANGNINPDIAEAIMRTFDAVPEISHDTAAYKQEMNTAYNAATSASPATAAQQALLVKLNQAAASYPGSPSYADYAAFRADPSPPDEAVEYIYDQVRNDLP